MAKFPAERGKWRGLKASDRSWELWHMAARQLGLSFGEYVKITMDFASQRHLAMEETIIEEFIQLVERDTNNEGI